MILKQHVWRCLRASWRPVYWVAIFKLAEQYVELKHEKLWLLIVNDFLRLHQNWDAISSTCIYDLKLIMKHLLLILWKLEEILTIKLLVIVIFYVHAYDTKYNKSILA
jgi:hypothetical protein